ncbi:glycoside hydrolase family 28 protein [Larkinella insperata]|uniref:Glycoside hydrolase family 28 protein n=1 Tax=Larkinella insperata TaxID=332158 RepID=A0ABW3Q888_9BACT
MKTWVVALMSWLALSASLRAQNPGKASFPDGSPISSWFTTNRKVNPAQLGKPYVITDFGVKTDSTLLQTEAIQRVIDAAAQKGGGVVVIPKGTFLSGALFFKPKTHLHLMDGAVLKGSDDIANYPKLPSRMEGQSLDYFAALVNAYQVDGFTISGKGTIDGNGLRFWEAFWARRKENPNCTNLEVSRPRLVFIWKCNQVQVQDVKLHNAGFWTSHYYQCRNVKILDVHIYSPYKPVKAPSTDAIDLDVCTNVLIKGCYMSVNDDAIALKGGKGPWADRVPSNGANTNILIEDCEFGFCHSALTCGSEAIHNRNILMRNCHVSEASRVLWLKMRPDTPQLYEYITVENIKGQAHSLLYAKPWTQFYDLQGRKDQPVSLANRVVLKNIELVCDTFFDVAVSKRDHLSNFSFENFRVKSRNAAIDKTVVNGLVLKNVNVNSKRIE